MSDEDPRSDGGADVLDHLRVRAALLWRCFQCGCLNEPTDPDCAICRLPVQPATCRRA